MGIGTSAGSGVRVEEHPSSWFAAIVGRKRWAMHPPNTNIPHDLMSSRPSCSLKMRFPTTVTCDQPAGTVMWVPDGWYHETCGLDYFSVGLGGTTFEGPDEYVEGLTGPEGTECSSRFDEYQLKDIPYCEGAGRCPSLRTNAK